MKRRVPVTFEPPSPVWLAEFGRLTQRARDAVADFAAALKRKAGDDQAPGLATAALIAAGVSPEEARAAVEEALARFDLKDPA